jgi:acyl-CoA reductase-like NAD-dependent aldehyde dehydrogenase
MEIAREEVFGPVISVMAFGGFKLSGFGRENGRDAVHEFTEVKTIWVALADAEARDPFALG